MTALTVPTNVPGVPLSRLVKVELRKMVDTRAGFWLAFTIVAISALITILALIFADGDDLTYGFFFGMMHIPLGLLLPVLAILLVTSESSQRTAMVTYTLEPRRMRVVLAKFSTAIVAAVGAVVAALAFGAIGNLLAGAIYSDPAGTWEMGVAGLTNSFLYLVIGLVEGFGFGLLLMNSPAAIVLFFVIPQVWSVVAAIVGWLREHIQQWADLEAARMPLQSDNWPSGEQWSHLAVAGAIWIGIPIVLGLVRLARSEVK